MLGKWMKLPNMDGYNYAPMPNGRSVAIPAPQGREDVSVIEMDTGQVITVENFQFDAAGSSSMFAEILDNKVSQVTGITEDLTESDYAAMQQAKPRLNNITLAVALKKMKAKGVPVKDASQASGMSLDTVKKYYACFQAPPPDAR